MLVRFKDMDNDDILIDPNNIAAVTEVYKYDDRGNRVKNDSRFIHLRDGGHVEVEDEIGSIYINVNNA